MASAEGTSNPLLSLQTSSESGLQAVLHPLVLLTISDYITRHSLRNQPGPIVGALLGQQNGRHITLEHAFECATSTHDGKVSLDSDWFAARLDQMRTIHKLDLVGWYTVLPRSGPTPDILPIHNWLMSEHNESSLLLAFHPEEALDNSVGGRLPLTIYESLYEADDKTAADRGASHDEDKEMRDREAPLELRFRELPYSVETGEAEMISMDFVARGAGNATMVEPREQKPPQSSTTEAKGKGKAIEQAQEPTPEENVLSAEEEETITALTAKANAVKMLQSRIDLLVAYLEHLPASYRSSDPAASEPTKDEESISPSHTILRSIHALVNRLPLLVPADLEAFQKEVVSEANDVNMVGILNDIMQSVTEARDVGRKYGIVEQARNFHKKHLDLREASGLDRSFMMNAGDLNV